MAVRQITIKPTHVAEMIVVFSEGYQSQILDVDGITLIPNPESENDYAGRMFDEGVKHYIHRRVLNYRNKVQTPVDQTEIIE